MEWNFILFVSLFLGLLSGIYIYIIRIAEALESLDRTLGSINGTLGSINRQLDKSDRY